MENECVRAQMARQGSPFLTTKAAAYYLGLCCRTLEKKRKNGSGPHYRRQGSYIRYHIKDLEAWLEGNPIRSNAKQRK